MGFWSNIFHTNSKAETPPPSEANKRVDVAVGSSDDGSGTIMTFNDKNITYSGELAKFDYDKVLRDKQTNIQD